MIETTIKLKGRVEIYEGDKEDPTKLIYESDNTIVDGGKIVSEVFRMPYFPNAITQTFQTTRSGSEHNYQHDYVTAYGVPPMFIVITDGSLVTKYWWCPIHTATRTDNTFKYIAKVRSAEPSGFLNDQITGVNLCSPIEIANCQIEHTAAAGDETILDVNTTRYSFAWASNVAIKYDIPGLTDAVQLLRPTTGDPDSPLVINSFRVYDDGTNWKIKFEGAYKPKQDDSFSICYQGGYIDSPNQTMTSVDQFSTVNISSNPIVKTSSTVLTIVWKITVS